MQDEEEYAGRDLHPSYVQDLSDCPPVVVSRFLYRIYAFLLGLFAVSSFGAITLKYCIYLLFDEADSDYPIPTGIKVAALVISVLTIALHLIACYYRRQFPNNARLLMVVALFSSFSIGGPAAQIKSRAFLNTLVVLAFMYLSALVLTQQSQFDFRERRVYIWIASITAAVFGLVTLVHLPTSFFQIILSLIGVLLAGSTVMFRLWQILPGASTDEDMCYAVDSYSISLVSLLLYFVFGKVFGQTHPL